ncbi:hypothetical protein D3C77_658640 [compost metagenome]
MQMGGHVHANTKYALGRSDWLFAGALRSGKRAAAIITLIQSARIMGMTRMSI